MLGERVVDVHVLDQVGLELEARRAARCREQRLVRRRGRGRGRGRDRGRGRGRSRGRGKEIWLA